MHNYFRFISSVSNSDSIYSIQQVRIGHVQSFDSLKLSLMSYVPQVELDIPSEAPVETLPDDSNLDLFTGDPGMHLGIILILRMYLGLAREGISDIGMRLVLTGCT